jgi:CubicO group peptidase (beta-lactamase class C family)
MPDDILAQIETGLLPPFRVQGEPAPTFALADRLAHHATPALSLAVIDQNAIVAARAYGRRAAGDPLAVTSHTLFQAASLSKPVGALAALRLAAAGELDLDADVNRYLRTWTLPANAFTRQQPVTVRHLLSHTGGVTVHGFPGYALGERLPTLVEMLDGLPPANTAAIRVDQLPGSAERYSGGGYLILQQLLTDLTGETFPALVQRLVFAPLGMTLSTYTPPDPQDARIALGHLRSGERLPGGYHVHPELAPAGLWTTPTDIAFFALGVMRAYRGERGALLPQAWAQAMLARPAAPGRDHPLGVQVLGEGDWVSFAHSGSNYGYRCLFVAYPAHGQGLVLMTNGERGDDLYAEVLRSAAQVYDWPGHGPHLKVLAPADPAAWMPYAGRFVLDDFPVVAFSIAPQPDRLLVTLEEPGVTTTTAVWPEAGQRFFSRDMDLELGFESPGSGQLPVLVLHRWGRSLRSHRV